MDCNYITNCKGSPGRLERRALNIETLTSLTTETRKGLREIYEAVELALSSSDGAHEKNS